MIDMITENNLAQFWTEAPSLRVPGDKEAKGGREDWKVQLFQVVNLDSEEQAQYFLLLEWFDPQTPEKAEFLNTFPRTDDQGRFGMRIGPGDIVVRARPNPAWTGDHEGRFALRRLERLEFTADGDPIPVY